MENIRWVIEAHDTRGRHCGYFLRFDSEFMGGGYTNAPILRCRKFETAAEAAEVVRNILAVEHPAAYTPPVLNVVPRDIGPKPYSVNVNVPYVDWTDHIDDWKPSWKNDVVVQFPDNAFSLDDFLQVCREPWFAANPDCDPATVQWERSTFSINWPPGTPWHQAVRIKTGSLHYPGWGVWRIQGLCFGRVMDRVVSSSAGMRRHHGWFCFEVIV